MSHSASSQGFISEQIYSTLRRLSIHLIAPIGGLPQIKVTVATPTLTTIPTSYANCLLPTKEWNKLHSTWVGRRAKHFARNPPRKVQKITKRRSKQISVKDRQRTSGPSPCRSDYRRKGPHNTLQRSRETSAKRKLEKKRPNPNQQWFECRFTFPY